MDIQIVTANPSYVNDCLEALLNSDVGIQYFSSGDWVEKEIRSGIESQQIHVALDENQVCTGFMWAMPNGAFHAFPYLHLIAIKKQYRGKGIGTKLMDYFENILFESSTRLFLLVGDFNPDAQRLYERLGYNEVTRIPNLYKNGVVECLMGKFK